MSDKLVFCSWRGLITTAQAAAPFDYGAHMASFDISDQPLYGPAVADSPQGLLGISPPVRPRQAPGAPGVWRSELKRRR